MVFESVEGVEKACDGDWDFLRNGNQSSIPHRQTDCGFGFNGGDVSRAVC